MVPPAPFEDPSALVASLAAELPRGIAGIGGFHAAYTAGEIGAHLGRWLIDHPTPILSWSHPDPASERNTANSLCCQNFILGMCARLGVRFDRIDLATAHPFAGKCFSDAPVRRLRETLKSSPTCARVDLPDAQIDQTHRFGLAMLAMAHEQGYAAATFKSWPDLFDCYGCAIDGAVSLCNDLGFCVAEEGEMPGALTSLALQLVSEGTAVANLRISRP